MNRGGAAGSGRPVSGFESGVSINAWPMAGKRPGCLSQEVHRQQEQRDLHDQPHGVVRNRVESEAGEAHIERLGPYVPGIGARPQPSHQETDQEEIDEAE